MLERYLTFEGTATRPQYWMRTLAFLVSSVAFFTLLARLNLGGIEALLGIVWVVLWLLVLLAVGMRRCREAGISPHWVWLWLLPFMGQIFYIVLGCLAPDDGKRISRPLSRPPKKLGLLRYFRFGGYTARQEYWCICALFFLFFTVRASFLFILALVEHGSASGEDIVFGIAALAGTPFLYPFLLTYLWLCAALVVRRGRDAGFPFVWTLIFIVVLVVPLDLWSVFKETLQSLRASPEATMPPRWLLTLIDINLFLVLMLFGLMESQEKA